MSLSPIRIVCKWQFLIYILFTFDYIFPFFNNQHRFWRKNIHFQVKRACGNKKKIHHWRKGESVPLVLSCFCDVEVESINQEKDPMGRYPRENCDEGFGCIENCLCCNLKTESSFVRTFSTLQMRNLILTESKQSLGPSI